ncbi:MAG: twin-arginine translocase subunit TatC, partial [Alphaproteobacteria bacterium]|nr:twin-arginine translocase subunit TatC [Alphaproteobacteria bacterium]
PVVLVLLARIGAVSAAQLSKFRRYAIVIIFIVAAVLTPPDVISQISLALPLMLLYEFSVLAAKWMEDSGKKDGPIT